MRIESLSELESYIFLLEDLYEEVITDYSRIVELLLKEFNISTNVHQIECLYEPTLEEDLIDTQLMLKNIMN